MKRGSCASSPVALRSSVTRLVRFASDTKTPGHTRSWSWSFDSAAGRCSISTSSRRKALPVRRTAVSRRRSSRELVSSVQSAKRARMSRLFEAASLPAVPKDRGWLEESTPLALVFPLLLHSGQPAGGEYERSATHSDGGPGAAPRRTRGRPRGDGRGRLLRAGCRQRHHGQLHDGGDRSRRAVRDLPA